MLPKTIVLPIDLAEGSAEALDYAVELAAKLGARIHVLHVVGIPALGVPEMGLALSGSATDGMMADDLHTLEHMIQTRSARADFGPPLIRSGEPRDVILEVAKELGADLIVMATHGRTGVARVLLGSVTESVVRASPCPVLAVKQHAETELRAA